MRGIARCGMCALAALSTLTLVAAPAIPPTDSSPSSALAELWEAPTDIATRDLFYGPWGAANVPDLTVPYTLQRKKVKGANPGMVVNDPAGREWHVKQGREARPEVIVSRILSAVGYHQPPVYFVPTFNTGSDRHVSAEKGGRFRLNVKQLKHEGDWSWENNPFVGTPPHQGLLVILVLLNSSDLKDDNNALYDLRGTGGGQPWFVVRDLGTSLGGSNRFWPAADDLKTFERVKFISGVDDGHVRFDYHAVHRNILDSITTADVRWACALLARLSDRQWDDAFRAGGYEGARAEAFIRRIHEKIQEGLHVAS